jgi:hypothetical protein
VYNLINTNQSKYRLIFCLIDQSGEKLELRVLSPHVPGFSQGFVSGLLFSFIHPHFPFKEGKTGPDAHARCLPSMSSIHFNHSHVIHFVVPHINIFKSVYFHSPGVITLHRSSCFRGNADVSPGASAGIPVNHHELDEEPAGGVDNAYDTVNNTGATGSKSKPPENTTPDVYAAVDKTNREGKPVREGFTFKGHWQPNFLLLISIRYTYGIFNFIFLPVCRV